jgi:hypothetical protein
MYCNWTNTTNEESSNESWFCPKKKETVVVSTDQRGARGRRWLVVIFCVSSLVSLFVIVIGR